MPDVAAWDTTSVVWKNKKFILDRTISIFHIPVNMGWIITRMWKKIQAADAAPPTDEWFMLSYDPSPWRGEHYASVSRKVPGAENVTITGTFLTKVFEGPYQDAGKWMREMQEYVKRRKKLLKKLYFFYTLCPKCAKHYGKNYTIAFAQV